MHTPTHRKMIYTQSPLPISHIHAILQKLLSLFLPLMLSLTHMPRHNRENEGICTGTTVTKQWPVHVVSVWVDLCVHCVVQSRNKKVVKRSPMRLLVLDNWPTYTQAHTLSFALKNTSLPLPTFFDILHLSVLTSHFCSSPPAHAGWKRATVLYSASLFAICVGDNLRIITGWLVSVLGWYLSTEITVKCLVSSVLRNLLISRSWWGS